MFIEYVHCHFLYCGLSLSLCWRPLPKSYWDTWGDIPTPRNLLPFGWWADWPEDASIEKTKKSVGTNLLRAPEKVLFACHFSDQNPWWASYGMGRCLLRSCDGAVRERRVPHRTGKKKFNCSSICDFKIDHALIVPNAPRSCTPHAHKYTYCVRECVLSHTLVPFSAYIWMLIWVPWSWPGLIFMAPWVDQRIQPCMQHSHWRPE